MRLRITEREFEKIYEALKDVGDEKLAGKVLAAHTHSYANKRFQRGEVAARND